MFTIDAEVCLFVHTVKKIPTSLTQQTLLWILNEQYKATSMYVKACIFMRSVHSLMLAFWGQRKDTRVTVSETEGRIHGYKILQSLLLGFFNMKILQDSKSNIILQRNRFKHIIHWHAHRRVWNILPLKCYIKTLNPCCQYRDTESVSSFVHWFHYLSTWPLL